MSNLTSDAERKRMVALCCIVNEPVWRSNTAMPTLTPLGTAGGRGGGVGEEDAGGMDGDGDGVVRADQVTGCGALPHAVAVSSRHSTTTRGAFTWER